jgi:hypothetical protein
LLFPFFGYRLFPRIRCLGQLFIGLLAIAASLCRLIGGAFYLLMAILVIAVIAYLFKMVFNTGVDFMDAVNSSNPVLFNDASPLN